MRYRIQQVRNNRTSEVHFELERESLNGWKRIDTYGTKKEAMDSLELYKDIETDNFTVTTLHEEDVTS